MRIFMDFLSQNPGKSFSRNYWAMCNDEYNRKCDESQHYKQKEEKERGKINKHSFFILILILSLSVAALFLGRYPSPGFSNIFADELGRRIVLQIRLPRILAALVLGMSMGGAGAVFQSVFRNPLVEPGFLGVTQGAAFGASAAILLAGWIPWLTYGSAFLTSLAGLSLSYLISRRIRFGGWIIRVVIAGLTVSALFTSLLGLVKYLADPYSQLQEITFWLLGGLSAVSWSTLWLGLAAASSALIFLYLYRYRVNLLALDDASAFSLGLRPGRERAMILGAASLAVASVTAYAGIIGWVGLLVPHVVRRFFPGDSRIIIPASMLFGAILMLFTDTLARVLFPFEIPLGILTAFFGSFLFLLILGRGGGNA
jgi:iron complex transport system permease protein